MGRRKGFDKKHSVTYSLIHTSAPAGEQAERLWIEKSRGVGVGHPDPEAAAELQHDSGSRYPPGHPLSVLLEEPAADLTDEQRQEIVDLGLPDDGYDYLKHLRDGAGSAGQSSGEQAGSSLLDGVQLGSRSLSSSFCLK